MSDSDPTPLDQDDQPLPPVNPVDEAVSTEARVMFKGLKLPESGPIPEDLAAELRSTLIGYLRRNRLNYAALGLGIQAGDSTVSEVLRGKYRGDVDGMLRRMNAWMEDHARQHEREKPIGFYETSVFMGLRDGALLAIRNARTVRPDVVSGDLPRIVMAVGPSGCGKTVGAQALRAAHPNSILIRIRQNAGRARTIARLITEAAGWRSREAIREPIEFVIERLRNSGRLLIVDEAHRTAESGYDFYRDLVDECGVPILLIGTDRIRRRVNNTRMGIAKGLLDDQFSRRVYFVMDLLRGQDGAGGSKRPFFSLEEIVAMK